MGTKDTTSFSDILKRLKMNHSGVKWQTPGKDRYTPDGNAVYFVQPAPIDHYYGDGHGHKKGDHIQPDPVWRGPYRPPLPGEEVLKPSFLERGLPNLEGKGPKNKTNIDFRSILNSLREKEK